MKNNEDACYWMPGQARDDGKCVIQSIVYNSWLLEISPSGRNDKTGIRIVYFNGVSFLM
jgi:hypothetical protein